jgi:hypothetical protein
VYSPPLFTTASQRSGRSSIPRLKKSTDFGREEVVEPILELSVVEGNSPQIVGERGEEVVIRLGQGPESRADVEESPSPVPEWPLSSCLRC